ncbi:MAG: hypothetical protein K0U72_10615 [Gammaproteobacteria bacterium]|nr:hypothetical protein [Gammaproteobacteria bacterium]
MSAKSGVVLCVLALAGSCWAEDAEAPDMAFLEYLGMWEESDEEWVLLEDDDVVASNLEKTESEQKQEDSVENEDET